MKLPPTDAHELQAGALPTKRRWSPPAWAVSVILHGLLLFAFATVPLTVAKALQSEDTLHVGIIVKAEVGPNVVFEQPEKRIVVPAVDSAPAPRSSNDLDELLNIDAPATKVMASNKELPFLADAIAGDSSGKNELPMSGLGGEGQARVRFFNAVGFGKSFVWVIDRSASMARDNQFLRAKQEVLQGLGSLERNHRFQVIVYAKTFEAIPDPAGGLLKADRIHIDHAKRFLDRVVADGGTEHNGPLLAAIQMQPDVIYFLTDADDMSAADVKLLTSANRNLPRSATIHAIEFGTDPPNADKPLRRLAAENDGSYAFEKNKPFGTDQ